MNFCVLIPAYNCAHVLPEVIGRVPLTNDMDEIIVADDASQDNTFSIASDLPRVYAVRNRVNLGYGGTSQKLYQIALERGADFTINLHGGFRHRPEDVEKISNVLQGGEYDIVTGSRLLYILDNIKRYGLAKAFSSYELRGGMPLIRVLEHIGLTGSRIYVMRHNYIHFMRVCGALLIQQSSGY